MPKFFQGIVKRQVRYPVTPQPTAQTRQNINPTPTTQPRQTPIPHSAMQAAAQDNARLNEHVRLGLQLQTQSQSGSSLPPTTEEGKAGTITKEEFASLDSLVEKYGAELIVQKIGKICEVKAKKLLREYSRSILGKAYDELAIRINAL